MRPTALIASAALLVPLCLPAQTPTPQQGSVFRTGVDLLTIDVSVVDGDGRQVTDLGAGELTVEVDGEPRQVVSAEYIRLVPEPGAAVGGVPEPVDAAYYSTNQGLGPEGRFILLLVDQGNIRAGMARAVLRAAARFLDDLDPADRVGLVAIPAPGVVVDFTTDHERVREGLLSIPGQGRRFKGRFALSITEGLAIFEHSDALLTERAISRECATASSIADLDQCERSVEQEAGELVITMRDQTQRSLRGMRDVLGSLAPIAGPKSIILISEGLVLEGLTRDVDTVAAIAADVRASLDVMLLDVPATDPAEGQALATPRQDRDLHMAGLESLAGLARGGLHRVASSPDSAFARIREAISGHYLVAIEAQARDRDGKRHRIEVTTSRRGGRINSRRGFLAPVSAATGSPEEAVTRALRAPALVSEIPMRLATWTFKEPGTARVRLLIAAEIERLADQGLDYTTGIIVVDDLGQAAANAVESRRLVPHPRDPGTSTYAGSVTVAPGTYRVRLAVADAGGRIGSVERDVAAFAMEGDALALGDLLLASAPDGGSGLLTPSVETRLAGEPMAALMEVYARAPGALVDLEATLEVLPHEAAPPLVTLPMRVTPGGSPDVASVQAHITTAALPPGRYLARATVVGRDGTRGDLIRPFVVMPRAASGLTSLSDLLRTALIDSVPTLDRRDLLAPAALAPVLAFAEHGRPAAAGILDQARDGRLLPASLAALEAGDQLLASFLRGLDSFTKADDDRAAQAFQSAMQMQPGFTPARLFLGASFAQGNRYREAASLLQSVPATLVSAAPLFAGETWLKAGDAGMAIASLEQAMAARPGARTARALGLAYVLHDRPADALPLLAGYLTEHPDDSRALIAAVYAVYSRHTPTARPNLAADRALAVRWADAYRATSTDFGDLVDAWVAHLGTLQ